MNRMWAFLFVFVCSVVVACPVVQANDIAIDNPSFENPVLVEDDWTWVDTPGWTTVGADGHGVWHVTETDFTPVVAPNGDNVVYTENSIEGVAAGVGQVLTETFEAKDYTLTADVGNSWAYYWSGYSVQLLAGGTVIAEDNNTLWPDYQLWDQSTVSYSYDAADAGLLGEPLEIRLLNMGIDMDGAGEGTTVGVEFDNVKLVPEPSTVIMLLSMSALGLLLCGRRRRA